MNAGRSGSYAASASVRRRWPRDGEPAHRESTTFTTVSAIRLPRLGRTRQGGGRLVDLPEQPLGVACFDVERDGDQPDAEQWECEGHQARRLPVRQVRDE